MRKIVKTLLAPASLALAAGTGIAATATPANAQVSFGLSFGTPYYYYRPYYYAPYTTYYYAPYCYWDAWYGRVCY